VLALWRSSGKRSAAMACFAESFVRSRIPSGYRFAVLDADERHTTARAGAALRILGDARNPWILQVSPAGSGRDAAAGMGARFMVFALSVVLLFLWGAVYFIARAIRREAAAAKLQTDFVARVSHEFRSPLTTVRQLSEMLEMDQVPSEDRRRRYYQVLSGEARRLQRLVETLLSFGKMEADAQQYRFERLDVQRLVERVVNEEFGSDALRERIEMKGPDTPLSVLGDGDALAMALRNLLDNALKYSPAGKPVEVCWAGEPGRVRISVTDQGTGIPREEQDRIFERFVRGREAVEQNIKGTGVGLAMVRHIMSAHGGEIRLQSEPGRGSTFTMVFAEAE
jgi:signal transduction histidine kinase